MRPRNANRNIHKAGWAITYLQHKTGHIIILYFRLKLEPEILNCQNFG